MFLGEGWRGIYIFEVRRVIFPSRTVAAVVHVIPKAGGTTGIALLANLCLCHFFQSYVYPRDEDFFYLIWFICGKVQMYSWGFSAFGFRCLTPKMQTRMIRPSLG